MAQTGATLETFHTYVPFYANELNTIMAAIGYHMTRAVPATYPQPTTTLSVTPTIPATLRVGYPFTINLAVQNTGNTNPANNLLEYAFAGNPQASDAPSILPKIQGSKSNISFNFLRRKDASQRALAYTVQSSATLHPNSWSDATPSALSTQTDSIDPNLESVTLTFTRSDSSKFYRLAVALSE
ncbi:MAG: hypothetical protein ACJA1W_000794 [Akkermansiaceae bacterium]|jgi:hypothetical protein